MLLDILNFVILAIIGVYNLAKNEPITKIYYIFVWLVAMLQLSMDIIERFV